MQNALARSSSYSLERAFGGSAPASTGRSTGRFSLVDTVSTAAQKEIPTAVLSYTPALTTHALGAALDQSAAGAKLEATWVGAKPSTVGMAVCTVAALAAPSRAHRRFAMLLLLGFAHAKLHGPAASVPELISRLAGGS